MPWRCQFQTQCQTVQSAPGDREGLTVAFGIDNQMVVIDSVCVCVCGYESVWFPVWRMEDTDTFWKA